MLRRTVFILIIQVFPILTYSQGSDSSYSTPLLEQYVNRCVDSLETIEYLKTYSHSRGLEFCNLAGCFVFLEAYGEDTLLNQAIFERIRQIAQRFYNDGTPILIHVGGINSVESCKRLNEEGNSYGITFISLGNSCLSNGSMDRGIQYFNAETKRLVHFPVSDDEK